MKTRTALIERLESLPIALRGAEQDLLTATACLTAARLALECREADLLLAGVEGGNAEVRKARLHVGSLVHQELLAEAQEAQARAALEVRVLTLEASCLRAVSRLIGGDDDA